MTYYSSPPLSNWQKQVICGTILGGSSIVKPSKGRNCYLFMRSSNRNWIIYKAEELKDFASQRPFTEEPNTLRWHSNCYPIFNTFRDIFYKNNKKTVTMEVLDTLRDIGLAVWYGDSGKIHKGNVWLNTHKFGEKANKLICKYFNEIDIKCDIIKNRGNYRIIMNKEGSQTFLKTIGHRLPDFMHSKLL
jgi:hypothetical protein